MKLAVDFGSENTVVSYRLNDSFHYVTDAMCSGSYNLRCMVVYVSNSSDPICGNAAERMNKYDRKYIHLRDLLKDCRVPAKKEAILNYFSYLRKCYDDNGHKGGSSILMNRNCGSHAEEEKILSDICKDRFLPIEKFIYNPIAEGISESFICNSDIPNLMIIDCGHENVDISIIDISNKTCILKNSISINHNGVGKIIENLCQFVLKENEIETVSEHAKNQLRKSCKNAIPYLSPRNSPDISVDSLDLDYELTYGNFINVNRDIFIDIMNGVYEVCNLSKIGVYDINHLIICGGGSYIPCIKTIMSGIFSEETMKTLKTDETYLYLSKGLSLLAEDNTKWNYEEPKIEPRLIYNIGFGLHQKCYDNVMKVVWDSNTPAKSQDYSEILSNVKGEALLFGIYEGNDNFVTNNRLLCSVKVNPDAEGCISVKLIMDDNFHVKYTIQNETGEFDIRNRLYV